MEAAEPQYVVLAGDWHGNYRWVLNYAIPEAERLLTEVGETRKIIIQLGDFGFRLQDGMPGAAWMHQLSQALTRRGMELWWIDGNHEFWPDIRSLLSSVTVPSDSGTYFMPAVKYLPRGTRWTWHGKIWLAVGGAVSVDRLLRREGVSWFPDEEITETEADRIIRDGPADILLSHDVPDCWFPSHLPPLTEAWRPMLPLARAHSRRLERIALDCEVERVFHGHYHHWRRDWYKEPYRGGCDVLVTGLLEDGFKRNLLLADVRNP